jgi:hypothetical protein
MLTVSDIKRTAKDMARHGIAYAKELAGAESKFCIRGAYRHRTEISYFDDTKLKDEYQREVYLRAADIAQKEQHVTTILRYRVWLWLQARSLSGPVRYHWF